ncbi:MAG: hypothetical protein ABI645_05260 [Pseudomonadota bacterium]
MSFAAIRRTFICATVLLATAGTSMAQNAGVPKNTSGKPNLNGIWQVLNEANWNLEPHIASQGPVETLGAIGAVAPGLGVVQGGKIPYLASAKEQRQKNFTSRRTEDPEAKCFMPGVPRATYLPQPFQIVQGDGDIMMLYQFAGAVRTINMGKPIEAPVDSWMGWSSGKWDGNTLVVVVTGLNPNWLDRSGNYASENRKITERYTMTDADHIRYEATIEDPSVFSAPWIIRMPLYRRMESDARLMDFRCVEFAEEMMYSDLRKPGTGAR